MCNVANSAINSLITPRSGETMRHQLGSNKNNLLRVCMVPTVTSANRVHKPATLCLINTRSLRSNANIICDFVQEHDMDIVCVTETWLSVRDANSCTSTIPGYTLEHIPRCNRNGGGVGVFFKDGFRLASSKPWPADSFECMEVVFSRLTASSALRLFVIYRPPSSGRYATPFSTFLVEFRYLVAHASMQQAGLALLGDFNVKYGNGDNKDARDFAALLEDSNLIQLVSSATHIKGNILDLVIAPATDSVISDVSVGALLTDHHAIVCHLNLPKPRPVQKQITYRKYCSIDNIKFAQDLATSPLHTAVGDTQTLCEQYNNELSVIIDNHAPLIRRTVNVRPRQPWRTDEELSTRRQVRQAERKWRHTRLHVHRQIIY